MRAFLAALCFFSLPAVSQPFVEIGVGHTLGGCIFDQHGAKVDRMRGGGYSFEPGCSGSPLGLFAIGYQFNDRWRIQLDHWSSLPDTNDRGVEIVSVRYRITFD